VHFLMKTEKMLGGTWQNLVKKTGGKSQPIDSL
jgi:hypothetical protein